MEAKALGAWGEQVACEYLVSNGFVILGKNYRIALGEIDVIARKKRSIFAPSDTTIHFIEVKTLASSSAIAPEQHVDARKQRKLAALCQVWLKHHGFAADYPYQIDIVAIIGTPGSRPKIEYFFNAFGDYS